jgi:hypothetical protein
MPNVKQIIKQYLKDHKNDGLCNHGCGCYGDNLFECYDDPRNCVPGKAFKYGDITIVATSKKIADQYFKENSPRCAN